MFRNLVIEYVPVIVFLLFTSYLLVKVIAMQGIKDSSKYAPVFLKSFLLFSDQEIRNTFHKKLEAYFLFSNRLNRIYYGLFGLFICVYVMMYFL